MAKKRRAAILPTNIILLQNVVRRDPESYLEEFLQQFSHYESLRDLYLLNPTGADQNSTTELIELIGFLSAVCNCYPKETANFPEELKTILLNNHRDLSSELREKIIQCLTMLRNKNVITAESLISTIFPLLVSYSSGSSGQHIKQMRKQIYSTLISLLKSVNTGAKNQKLNRSTQALLFNLLEQKDNQGLWATKLTRELWRKGIWDDSRTVELMTQAALHPDVKVSIAGVKFFLGADKEREDNFEENSDDEGFDMTELKHKMQHNKASKKRTKRLENAVKQMKKKSNSKHSATYLNFSAIHLLRDPQGFAEQLFDSHLSAKNSNKFDLDQKIIFMNLISRMIGTHKLIVLGIYTFFLKYLTPKQRNVTQIMAASAQASHDLVPPESIEIVVRKIADEFVSDGVAAEVASAGINTIREILSRAPLAIDSALLQDLTEYKGSKSKAVMMAARSLISLYREVAPEMLLKKDRGKTASIELQKGEKTGLPKYGVENTITSIPGIELLAKWRKEQGLAEGDENDDKNWEVDESENDSDIEGDWVTVESDKDIDIDISDSEDEKPNKDDEVSDLELSDSEDEEVEVEGQPSEKKAKTEENTVNAEQAMTELLSSRILTPADFAKLEELRTEAGLSKLMGTSNEETVDSTTLVGKVKYKQLREERIAHAKEGKEDREKFGSRKGKREAPHSTTNKEKARKKNFVMMIHKKAVQGKQKLSLRDRQRVLRAHIDKQKKKGKVGNNK
ncbi:unnamed protein product [Candida verbasci]|uniref:Protein SDA1 n=1 Tax=Candida verbasci TaxID=1227364 RepID=A0A9W4TRR1_9ASCO|nr:unnamed protein product [Candida verbasci]